jgi:FKBP-type peptidyl-prolyl cis-trans isomerase (trigger factor)
MALKVDIKDVGACRKHISVTVPESGYSHDSRRCLGDLITKAQVPGFRVGKVPTLPCWKNDSRRKLLRDIKQKVLMASLEQLSDDSKIEPISEPRIDVESLDIPEPAIFTTSSKWKFVLNLIFPSTTESRSSVLPVSRLRKMLQITSRIFSTLMPNA